MNKKNPSMKIGNRIVGLDYPPLVIAEIGINHNGSLETAKKMVDEAFLAGAEIIKHQTHIVSDEMSHAAKYIKPGNSNESIYEIMKRAALSETEETILKEYVETKGMIFISTPFSRSAADRLEKMDVCAYKIGSGECNNYPLIEHIAKFKKPMIISTGMNDISTIRGAVAILEQNNIEYALLHTTNIYPTPPYLVRLGGMVELQKNFPNVVVGLSDHTTSNLACFAATALGASILERHFTDSMDRKGPDIINSMDPIALKSLLIGSKNIALMRGGEKCAANEEQVTMDFAFASVVTIKDIKHGDIFTTDNIWVKRPGSGEIKARFFKNILGKKSKRNISVDEQLCWSDIDE